MCSIYFLYEVGIIYQITITRQVIVIVMEYVFLELEAKNPRMYHQSAAEAELLF